MSKVYEKYEINLRNDGFLVNYRKWDEKVTLNAWRLAKQYKNNINTEHR